MMKMIQGYWRPFEEWVIAFVNRFQHNLFLQTQLTFAVVLFLFCALNVLSLGLVAHYVQEDAVDTMLREWGDVLVERSPAPAITNEMLFAELATNRSIYFTIISMMSVLLTLILSFIAARIALGPTRNAITAQKEFIGHIAHELRTPISIAKTNSEVALLQVDELGKDEMAEALRENIVELDHLSGIINNLMSLNALIGMEPDTYHMYDLNEIIMEVAEKYQIYIDTKEITLDLDLAPQLEVWVNRSAMIQMISNIVGNAISFSPLGGKIELSTEKISERFIRLCVSDHGIGIPEEELTYVFKPFYRSQKLRHKLESGSGLGLAIVKELVRLHSGSITIQSKEGKGTKVIIDLPIYRKRYRGLGKESAEKRSGEIIHDFSKRSLQKQRKKSAMT